MIFFLIDYPHADLTLRIVTGEIQIKQWNNFLMYIYFDLKYSVIPTQRYYELHLSD